MFSTRERDQFFNMVDSLKKSQRADLKDISKKDIIKDLYVDPMQNEFVIKSVSKLNNSILLGRKGTGKSTILARLQSDISKNKDKLFVYVDVKSIYDRVAQTHLYDLKDQMQANMPKSALNSYLFYKQFTLEFMDSLKIEIKNNITSIIPFNKNPEKIIKKIEENFAKIEESSKEDIDLLRDLRVKTETSVQDEISAKASAKVSIHPSAAGEVTAAEINTQKSEVNYSATILRIFPFLQVMKEIKEILKAEGINFVFIALDDFSELDESTMKIFVDIIVSPLNNSMFDFYKLKICAYPYRCHLGNIDPTKIDPIKLDYYEIYSSDRIDKVEKDSIDFVKRLLENRSDFFLKRSFADFLDLSKHSEDVYFDLLFKVSYAIPRNLGWILWYTYRLSIAKNRKITLVDINNASKAYYGDIIEKYLSKDVYLKSSYEEKLAKYELKNLLDLIKDLARKNKAEIRKSNSKIFQMYGENPPTSHFFIEKNLEDLLHTLELNFFVSKISEQKDQDSQKIMSFYCLNYGFCQKEDIIFGKGDDRKYRIQRRFNYSENFRDFINSMKEIICDSCKASYTMDVLEMLSFYDMMCPKCKQGKCHIENKFDISTIEQAGSTKMKLVEVEFDFLNSVNITGPQPAKELAQDLDVSYQKVTKIADKLEETKLIVRNNIRNRTYYNLTNKAQENYFGVETNSSSQQYHMDGSPQKHNISYVGDKTTS